MNSSTHAPHILAIDDSRAALTAVEKAFKSRWLVYGDGPHGITMEIKDHKSDVALSEPVHIITAESAAEGCTVLRSQKIDLILLDVIMPGINGIDFLHVIRKDAEFKDLPVIVMSADMSPNLESAAFGAGATDFIHKPYEADVIRLRVAQHLLAARMHEDLNREVSRQTERAEEQAKRAEEQAKRAEEQAEIARRAAERNQKLLQETVTALSEAIDAKDRYTRGHSVRVANYSKTLSALAGDSKAEQEYVKTMALLHDIGKIGIPEDIITKPSRLTEKEYELIKTHTTIGARILGKITEAKELSLGAHYHHERYDGKGYPDGLAGEQIPRWARIIGVADAYDTMTSKRSYRDCLPQKVVREQLIQGMGTQFDPQFASLMVKMMDMDKNYRMRADLDSPPVFDPVTAAPGPQLGPDKATEDAGVEDGQVPEPRQEVDNPDEDDFVDDDYDEDYDSEDNDEDDNWDDGDEGS